MRIPEVLVVLGGDELRRHIIDDDVDEGLTGVPVQLVFFVAALPLFLLVQ